MNQLFITARKYYFPIIYYILVILTLSTIYLFFKATSDNKEDSNLYYEISSSISSTITECTNVADNIAANHSVLNFSQLSDSTSPNVYASAIQIQEFIALAASDLPSDTNINVYFPQLSITVTQRQFILNSDFSKIFSHYYGNFSYEQLLSKQNYSWNCYLTDTNCLLVRSIIFDGNAKAYIIVSFPYYRFDYLPEGNLIFIGDDNSCAYSNSTINIEYQDLLDQLKDSKDRFVYGENSKSYYLLRNEFSSLPLKILVLVPLKKDSLSLLQYIILIIISFCLFVGAPFFLYQSKQKKLQLFQSTEAAETYINIPINSSISKSRDFSVLLGGLAQQLLNLKAVTSEKSISSQFYRLIQLSDNEECILIGFSFMSDEKELFDEPNSISPETTPVTPYFILNNMLQDLVFNHHRGALFRYQNHYIASFDSLPEETETDISAITDQLILFARNSLHVVIISTGAFSCNNTNSLKCTLQQVIDSLNYEAFWYDSSDAEQSPIEKSMVSSEFYQLVVQLNTCMREKNYFKASELYNTILDNNIPSNKEGQKKKKIRLQILLDCLIPYTDYPITDLAINMSPHNNIHECRILGQQVFQNLISSQKKKNTDPTTERIISIQNYIQENYADENLSVSFIASKYEVNASYLSRAFKDITGMNLLEYIHKTRISAAKIFLKEYPVKDACIMSGFTDTQSFVRIFRKYESITPAEYRTTHTSK